MGKIDISDVLIILGLTSIGVSLFLWFNLGILLITIGILSLNFGILRAISGKSPGKD